MYNMITYLLPLQQQLLRVKVIKNFILMYVPSKKSKVFLNKSDVNIQMQLICSKISKNVHAI